MNLLNVERARQKMALVEKLIKEEKITFEEGLLLMETEKEYIAYPSAPQPYWYTTPVIQYDFTQAPGSGTITFTNGGSHTIN